MSHEATNWALPLRLPTREKIVLLILAARARDVEGKQECFPSVASLAEDTGLAERSIQYALRSLGQAALITLEGGGGRSRRNVFTLCVGAVYAPNGAPVAPNPILDKVQPVQKRVQGATEKGAMVAPGTLKRTIIEPEGRRGPTAEVLELFPSQPQGDIAQRMLEIWNATCGAQCKAAKGINDHRKRVAPQTLKAAFGGSLDAWEGFCHEVSGKEFLTGNGSKGWKADFDFAIRPDTCLKLREGKYDRRTSPPRAPTTSENRWSYYADDPGAVAEPAGNVIDGEVLERGWGP